MLKPNNSRSLLSYYDKDYIYFFHGTNHGIKDIESFFNNGLDNYSGCDLNATAKQYTGTNGEDLIRCMKQYCDIYGYANVILIRIPFRIMNAHNRNNEVYIPMPIWKRVKNNNVIKGVLCPHLIAGMYFSNTNEFIENSNYSPMFNPSGFCYDKSQIDFLNSNGLKQWYDYAIQREQYFYNDLLVYDEQRRTYDDTVKRYSEIIKPRLTKPFKLDNTQR